MKTACSTMPASKIENKTQVAELRRAMKAEAETRTKFKTSAGKARAASNCQVPAGGWTGRVAHRLFGSKRGAGR
jgi:hypothetical protein